MTVVAITPTANRPEALKLCRRWMDRQTVPCRHVVVGPGGLYENLERGLEHVLPGAVWVFLIEDDVWYPANWLETCIEAMQRSGARLCGQRPTMTYHLHSGGFYFRTGKKGYPLHATSMSATLVPLLREAIGMRTDIDPFPMIDRRLWSLAAERDVPRVVLPNLCAVDLKGLPGTPGLTGKHRGKRFRMFDKDRSVLRTMLGEDAEAYLALVELCYR